LDDTCINNNKNNNGCKNISSLPSATDHDERDEQLWIVSIPSNDSSAQPTTDVLKDPDTTTECCICMCDFHISNESTMGDSNNSATSDIETGLCRPVSPCEAVAVGGDKNEGKSKTGTNDSNGIDNKNSNDAAMSDDTIVRTLLCGHLFHRRCIASWVGGRWQQNTTQRRQHATSINNQLRARRVTCPLCRRDLRPATTSSAASSLTVNETSNSTTTNDTSNTIPTYNTFQ
jgi:hypothetical protein